MRRTRFCQRCGAPFVAAGEAAVPAGLPPASEEPSGEYRAVYHNTMLLSRSSLGCAMLITGMVASLFLFFAAVGVLVGLGILIAGGDARAWGLIPLLLGGIFVYIPIKGWRDYYGPVLASQRYIRSGQPLAVVEGPSTFESNKKSWESSTDESRQQDLKVDGVTFNMNFSMTYLTHGPLKEGAILRVWYVPTTGLLVAAAVLAQG